MRIVGTGEAVDVPDQDSKSQIDLLSMCVLHQASEREREREREREGIEKMGRSGVVLFLLFLGCFTASAATTSFISGNNRYKH